MNQFFSESLQNRLLFNMRPPRSVHESKTQFNRKIIVPVSRDRPKDAETVPTMCSLTHTHTHTFTPIIGFLTLTASVSRVFSSDIWSSVFHHRGNWEPVNTWGSSHRKRNCAQSDRGRCVCLKGKGCVHAISNVESMVAVQLSVE